MKKVLEVRFLVLACLLAVGVSGEVWGMRPKEAPVTKEEEDSDPFKGIDINTSIRRQAPPGASRASLSNKSEVVVKDSTTNKTGFESNRGVAAYKQSGFKSAIGKFLQSLPGGKKRAEKKELTRKESRNNQLENFKKEYQKLQEKNIDIKELKDKFPVTLRKAPEKEGELGKESHKFKDFASFNNYVTQREQKIFSDYNKKMAEIAARYENDVSNSAAGLRGKEEEQLEKKLNSQLDKLDEIKNKTLGGKDAVVLYNAFRLNQENKINLVINNSVFDKEGQDDIAKLKKKQKKELEKTESKAALRTIEALDQDGEQSLNRVVDSAKEVI